jgi:hypothetical protein
MKKKYNKEETVSKLVSKVMKLKARGINLCDESRKINSKRLRYKK